MKKYLIFILSFFLLFFILQISSGILLTATYTPEITDAWYKSQSLTQEVAFGEQSQIPTILMAGLAATLAYFVPKKWAKG